MRAQPVSSLVAGLFVALLIVAVPAALWIGIKIGASIPELMLWGVLLLLGVLLGFTVLLKLVGISDPKQALGMPEGSIRAIVTLALLAIFTVLAALVFVPVGTRQVNGLTAEQVQEFRRQNPELARHAFVTPDPPTPNTRQTASDDATLLAVQQPSRGSAQRRPVPPAPPIDPVRTFTVETPLPRSGDDDFVKTTMTGVMTLMTAVIAFYFGGRTSEAASRDPAARAKPLPALGGLEPSQHKLGSEPLNLNLVGTGLNDVKRVLLRHGDTTLQAVDVASSDTTVKAKLELPADAARAKWDVVVIDAAGAQDALLGQLTVS